MMRIRSGIMATTAAVFFISACSCGTAFLETKPFTFEGVSTASKPPNPHNILASESQYSIVKVILTPSDWRADVTWAAPREHGVILSDEAVDKLSFKFLGASFHFMKYEKQRQLFPWSMALAKAQQENGPPTRHERRTSGEFVYWGPVSINDSDKYNCAADCLVLFHWGTDEGKYTVHLWGRMQRELWRSPVP